MIIRGALWAVVFRRVLRPGPGVARDPRCIGWSGVNGAGLRLVVVRHADYDGVCPGKGGAHRGAEQLSLFIGALEVVHLSGTAGFEPGFESLALLPTLRRSSAGHGR